MQREEVYARLPGALLPWYAMSARDLPWRRDREPYHVWLSEIMLQQTRVEAARGYYLRFLEAFPAQAHALRLDSHQHTHAIPAVFDTLLAAVRSCGCTLSHLRTPVEPLEPHLARRRAAPPVNIAKNTLLALLWRMNRGKLPSECATSLFCGVVLSGCMERVDEALVAAFRSLATQRGQAVEFLSHPVSVPRAQCLDPENAPFAAACAAPGRDAEARALQRFPPISQRAEP